jgi:acyl-CoA thioesterase-2
MHQALGQLLDVLDLERIDAHAYRGVSPGLDRDHLFGGQVLAQALVASHRSSRGDPAHSLHAYFLRRGTPRRPIRYEVKRLRASRAFESFQVNAVQDDETILQMIASHHIHEEGPVHQIPMDAVGPPQGEAYEHAMLRVMAPAGADSPEMGFELPVEIKGVGGLAMFSSDVKPPNARCWLRVRDKLPDDLALHQCLFAYASDYAIMAPALNPHPFGVTAIQSASLDHAIWFHRPFRLDEWMLFELDSPVAGGGRGLGRGLLYDQGGELVASCVQEALMRPLAGQS